MSFLNDFVLLLKARYPIIYISTYEEERVEYIIRYCIKKYVSRTYYSWDFVEGYQGNPNDVGFATKNPLEALDLIDKLTSSGFPTMSYQLHFFKQLFKAIWLFIKN
jgi:hypothetical protein